MKPQPPDSIHLSILGNDPVTVPEHTRVREALEQGVRTLSDPNTGLPYLAGLVNNDVCSMDYPLHMNCALDPITFVDRHGTRVYRRTLSFLLAKAVHACFPTAKFAVEHSLGDAYYCSFQLEDRPGIRPSELESIRNRLQEVIEADIPINRRSISYEEAERRLMDQGLTDKLNLLQYRNPPMITMYECEEFADAGLGVLAPRSGCVPCYRLLEYEPGFVIQFPKWDVESKRLLLPDFERQPHLFKIIQEYKQWGKVIGVTTVGDLNSLIAHRK
ncbi:MAG: hypothetical protein PF795_02535 [Kiritimatiellae bacterium]|jgi:uridine kinase|nr:hypothetical protein [Kiritimatiellia bacterium]